MPSMLQIRKGLDRGHSQLGWLDSYHTFSFSSYQDPRFMGFESLRVINDDIVMPGKGFQTHSHNDMEIITYVLDGALAHKDSLGNGSIINTGDVQRMSAGTGIQHSEFNQSEDEQVHFLQIWFLPNQLGVQPGYEQKSYSRQDKLGKWCLIASPNGEQGSVSMNQQANVYATILSPENSLSYELPFNKRAWLQVAQGALDINNVSLEAGDGIAITSSDALDLKTQSEAEVLLFEMLPYSQN